MVELFSSFFLNHSPKKNMGSESSVKKEMLPTPKSYVLIIEPIDFNDLDVQSILDGENDISYKGKKNNIAPSAFFEMRCHLFSSIEPAIKKAQHRGKTAKSAYIMEMGYTIDEIRKIAAQGNFSKGIIRAVNAKDLDLVNFGMKEKKDVEKIENPYYELNLLQKVDSASKQEESLQKQNVVVNKPDSFCN